MKIKQNFGKNIIEIGQNITGKDIPQVSILGTVLGLDSGKVFDDFAGKESGEFEGYEGCAEEIALKKVSIAGKSINLKNIPYEVGRNE